MYNVKDIIEYGVSFVSEFAKAYGLRDDEAFRYLDNFKAIDIIVENYGVMHTQSYRDMVADISTYCCRKGGTLSL